MTYTRSANGHRFVPGAEVEVRTRYLFSWTRGFEVASIDDDHHVRLRRRSDASILPMAISVEQVRPSR
jgi:hypothetical protein